MRTQRSKHPSSLSSNVNNISEKKYVSTGSAPEKIQSVIM
jgi:hypothetical protein